MAPRNSQSSSRALSVFFVQVPGADDPEEIKRLLSTTAKLTFHLVHPEIYRNGQRKPAGYLDLRGSEAEGGQRYWVRRLVDVGGDRLVDAQPTFEQIDPSFHSALIQLALRNLVA